MKDNIDIILVGIVVILGGLYLGKMATRKNPPPQVETSTQDLASSEIDLKTFQGLDVYDQLSKPKQRELIGVFKHYCLRQYHPESCIHYYLTCGTHCIPYLDKYTRKKITRDHKRLVAVVKRKEN